MALRAIGRDLSVTSRCHSTFLSGSDTRMWCLAGQEGKQAGGEPSSKARVWTSLEKAGDHFAGTENNFSSTKGGIRGRARAQQRNGELTVEEQFLCNQSLSTSAGAQGSVHVNEGSTGRCLPAGGRGKRNPYSCGDSWAGF